MCPHNVFYMLNASFPVFILAGSTGQRGLKQFWVKVASPEQSVPPLAGAGLVHVLRYYYIFLVDL